MDGSAAVTTRGGGGLRIVLAVEIARAGGNEVLMKKVFR